MYWYVLATYRHRGWGKNMIFLPENLQICMCCETAPPSDCSEKYCSGYSVLHFSPKPRQRGFPKVHSALPNTHLSQMWFRKHPGVNTQLRIIICCLLRSVHHTNIIRDIPLKQIISKHLHFHYTAVFLRPRASCTFAYPTEGGAQDTYGSKGDSYLHLLFQQLFPKLWDSSCFSHQMTSTITVGFNEQISFRGKFTFPSCTFCVVNLAWTEHVHLLPLISVISA